MSNHSEYLNKVLLSRVYDVAVETPLDEAVSLSRRLGNRVLLKRDDLQPVFSFKLRGAYNKMARLSPEELRRGVHGFHADDGRSWQRSRICPSGRCSRCFCCNGSCNCFRNFRFDCRLHDWRSFWPLDH